MKKKIILINGKKINPNEQALIRACIIHKQRKGLHNVVGKLENTVKSQLYRLFLKLGVHTLSELILLALDNGFDKKGRYKAPK